MILGNPGQPSWSVASPSKSPSPNPHCELLRPASLPWSSAGTTALTEARKSGDRAPPPSQSEEPTPRCPSDPKMPYRSHKNRTGLVWVYQPKG